MKDNNRIYALDILKALAILIVIVTHVLSRNLGSDIINRIWNYLHFVVPIFVFSSGYVLYRKYHAKDWKLKETLGWYKRRAVRLLIPYYLFLIVHYLLWLLFPQVLTGYGLSWSPRFFISSLALVGVDYGWLPILFLELMMLTPLYLAAWKIRPLRYVLIGLFGVSTIFVFAGRSPIDYRLVMWLPWSFVYALSFEASRVSLLERGRQYVTPLLLGALGFLSIYGFSTFFMGHVLAPLTLTLHKYPPDFYYLSYGLGLGSLLLYASLQVKRMASSITFISEHSYSLFFVHYIGIDIVEKIRLQYALSVPVQLVAVIGLSLICMALVTRRKTWSFFTG